jgi:hybrid cluster-associated redox disulfide protein
MDADELGELTVSEIMRRWPATMRLFIDRRLLCVGCPIAPFHTLTDVAREHHVDEDALVEMVLAVAQEGAATAVPASVPRRSAPIRADRTP